MSFLYEKIPIKIDSSTKKKSTRVSKNSKKSHKTDMPKITPSFDFLNKMNQNDQEGIGIGIDENLNDIKNIKKHYGLPQEEINFDEVMKKPFDVQKKIIEVIPREKVEEKKPQQYPPQQLPQQLPQKPPQQPPQQIVKQTENPIVPNIVFRPMKISEKIRQSYKSSIIKRKKSMLKRKYEDEMKDIDKNKLSLKKIKLNREKVKIKRDAEKLKELKIKIKEERAKLKEEKEKLKDIVKNNKDNTDVNIKKIGNKIDVKGISLDECNGKFMTELNIKDSKIKSLIDELESEKDKMKKLKLEKDKTDNNLKNSLDNIDKLKKNNENVKMELSKITNLYNKCKTESEKTQKNERELQVKYQKMQQLQLQQQQQLEKEQLKYKQLQKIQENQLQELEQLKGKFLGEESPVQIQLKNPIPQKNMQQQPIQQELKDLPKTK